MIKDKLNPSFTFLFTLPCRHMGGTLGRKRDPINLFRPKIISSWAWSYLTVEKRKKTFIFKFN
ncbi:hypothetical protein ES288_D11G393100v1 [Gossypium darwinii]|uniref:Uncharacterized protein n=1 Tax=Gossypium darwinii TaxID=34276 RepID=A0A5D2AT42_GOSDA|nr:hypothetical protein ES288_D11G393100v1 [Gossypium darwinii]